MYTCSESVSQCINALLQTIKASTHIDISQNLLVDIDFDIYISQNLLDDIDINIDIDIFNNDHINNDIDMDIFQKCRYIDNRYFLSIYRTGLK